MPTPFEISEVFTEKWADLSPLDATSYGVPGRDHLCTDFSPEGHAARADLYRATRSALEPHVDSPDPTQAFAARVVGDWLQRRIDDFDQGRWQRDLNHIESPFQTMRDVFDVMPRANVDHWEAIGARLRGFETMLAGYRESMQRGVTDNDTVAARQVESVVKQAENLASDESRFLRFPDEAARVGANREAMAAAVDEARAACHDFARWLKQAYLPAARPSDAVGRERYMEGVEEFVGMQLDLDQTYEWGWDELHRIRDEMGATADQIDSGLTLPGVIELLETDPARSAATHEEFVDFVAGVQQQAIGQLAGEHFDVPDELKVVTVNIAPPGGSLGAWYMAPAEDFSRPGSIWYAPGERERIAYWQEVSTAYHEGFPGHHLQVGTAVLLRDKLDRFHRVAIWSAGSGEGWALYAERLMDELGFFEKPEYRLGLLASQLFRTVRVVVDIGCQLELRIPDGAPLHPGEQWGYGRAVDYMNLVGLQPRDVSESEVTRYLGWYGQAISYKVGEREILAMRERARRHTGFDLKGFHRRILEAGGTRLDHLWDVMK